jgi:hypothetical protein
VKPASGTIRNHDRASILWKSGRHTKSPPPMTMAIAGCSRRTAVIAPTEPKRCRRKLLLWPHRSTLLAGLGNDDKEDTRDGNPANHGAADESRDDDEYQAFYSSLFSPRLVPNRGAGESAGDDIIATPGDRRNNDGRYEDLWSDWQDAGRDRGVPAEKGNEAPKVDAPPLAFGNRSRNPVNVSRRDREPSRPMVHDRFPRSSRRWRKVSSFQCNSSRALSGWPARGSKPPKRPDSPRTTRRTRSLPEGSGQITAIRDCALQPCGRSPTSGLQPLLAPPPHHLQPIAAIETKTVWQKKGAGKCESGIILFCRADQLWHV